MLLVIAGGLLVMGYETLQTSYTVKDVAPRLVIGMVAANFSQVLVGQAIEFANQLAPSCWWRAGHWRWPATRCRRPKGSPSCGGGRWPGWLGIQVAQALVFVIALKVLFTLGSAVRFGAGDQLWDLLIVVCLLYVLVRIPSWIGHPDLDRRPAPQPGQPDGPLRRLPAPDTVRRPPRLK